MTKFCTCTHDCDCALIWNVDQKPQQTLIELAYNAVASEPVPNPWIELHQYRWSSACECKQFYEDWIRRALKLMGTACTCETHWEEIVAARPPKFDSAEEFFEWGVEAHNDVSKRTGRTRLWTVEEAYRYYQQVPSDYTAQWRFVTLEDLARVTRSMIPLLPQRINRVVAMHRSGSPPAALIASMLHVPCDVFSASTGLYECTGGGRTAGQREYYQDGITLVVDDTIASGHSLSIAKNWFRENKPGVPVSYAAVFAMPSARHMVDVFGEYLPDPHLLEWNCFNCGFLAKGNREIIPGGFMLDFDGVICADPPKMFDETTTDGRRRYLEWIENAPLLNPARFVSVPSACSYRCEYTREATMRWLDRHGIQIEELRLFPGEPSERTWRAEDWKGAVYANSSAELFVESSSRQASDIAKFSGKRVLDLESKQIIGNP